MSISTITTERLLLIPCTARHIEACMAGHRALSDMIGYQIPDSWPVFPEGIPWWLEELRADPSMVGWANWIFVLPREMTVIGDGGFKGKPNADGEAEIGYAIVPEFQEQGFATEAAGALIEWAFSHPDVTSVRAHTLADGHGSINVLKKNGMEHVSNHLDPEDGEISQWRIVRENYRTHLLSIQTKGELS